MKMKTPQDPAVMPDHVLALSIIRAQLIVDTGNKGMRRRLQKLRAEHERRKGR